MKNETTQTNGKVTKCFDIKDKKYYLKKINKIADHELRDLVDAINSVDNFFVVRQYPGFARDRSTERLPTIEFFVMFNGYDIANMLMLSIIQEFGMAIKCKLEYHAEFEEVDNYAIETGVVILTYVIEFESCKEKYYIERYAKLVDHINEFASQLNRSVE